MTPKHAIAQYLVNKGWHDASTIDDEGNFVRTMYYIAHCNIILYDHCIDWENFANIITRQGSILYADPDIFDTIDKLSVIG